VYFCGQSVCFFVNNETRHPSKFLLPKVHKRIQLNIQKYNFSRGKYAHPLAAIMIQVLDINIIIGLTVRVEYFLLLIHRRAHDQWRTMSNIFQL